MGVESTGKTTLAQQLAAHYHTVAVPEYARNYLSQLQRPYTLADIDHIAQQQLQLEAQYTALAQRYLFCDTNLIVCKIWAEHVFGTCPPFVSQHLPQTDRYALHLLTNIDLAWQPDPLREHPHIRPYLHQLYLDELHSYHLNYCLISGSGQARLRNAIDAIEQHKNCT